MARRGPAIDELRALLAEQNEAAAMMDQAMREESTEGFVSSTRRFAGPAVGDRVLILEIIACPREQLDDALHPRRNLARLESMSWAEALAAGQRASYDSGSRVSLDFNELTGSYRLRLDGPVTDVANPYEGQEQIAALALAEALREGDQISLLASDDPGFEELACEMAERAAKRAEAVLLALSGEHGSPAAHDLGGG